MRIKSELELTEQEKSGLQRYINEELLKPGERCSEVNLEYLGDDVEIQMKIPTSSTTAKTQTTFVDFDDLFDRVHQYL